MKASRQRWLAQSKRRIQRRLRPIRWTEQSKPMFAAQNIVYLDALGAQRIPDLTTEGDFCRRFSETDVELLLEVINGDGKRDRSGFGKIGKGQRWRQGRARART